MKKALITGIYGQDGSFLYELLDELGYQVYGIARRNLSSNSEKVKTELERMGKRPIIYEIDLLNYNDICSLLEKLQVDELYHLSASHVSSEGVRNGNAVDENRLFQDNVNATSNILAACSNVSEKTKILTAGSCLMFDDVEADRQDETTPFKSRSLYGIGKITENQLVDYYRKKGVFACTAILYNHESYRRSKDFVTKKIVRNMCMIKQNPNHRFSLGDISIKKDWGYARDYVRAMHMMLQSDRPKDYILSSGELHSIRDFIDICAGLLHIEQWERHVDINQVMISRSNQSQLYGNPKLIEEELGWKRTKDLKDIIEEMIKKEMENIGN